MKHQQVSVDYWAMGKAMLMYGVLTALGWMMMRLFNTVFTLPRRMRAQQENIQNTLQELQKRFPDLNITEEDLKNADKELEAFIKEEDERKEKEAEAGEKETESGTADAKGKVELEAVDDKEDSENELLKKEVSKTVEKKDIADEDMLLAVKPPQIENKKHI